MSFEDMKDRSLHKTVIAYYYDFAWLSASCLFVFMCRLILYGSLAN